MIKIAPGVQRDSKLLKVAKPVNVTQGHGAAAAHPDAIHDRYPPIGTAEHAKLHGTAELPKSRQR